MKILLTMNLPYTRAYGGANRSNRALCEALAGRGHQVRVVAPILATPSPVTRQQVLDELIAEDIPVSSMAGADVFCIRGVEIHAVEKPSMLRAHLAAQLTEFSPNWTLVSAEDPSQSLLDAALKHCPSRVIYLAHTPQMFPFGPMSLYPGEARTELVKGCSVVVAISRFVADYIRQWSGLEPHVIHFPHYGSYPFPRLGHFDNRYILFMNASSIKGIGVFLKLARQFPALEFAALAGYATTNEDRSALLSLANVTLLKNPNHLDDVLRDTRLLLMPSMWGEGFGMAVIDAMLRGIPVVASNHGGLPEAKLGTNYLLPIRPIDRFEERLGSNMLPIPVIPEQDIRPWYEAVRALTSDPVLYQTEADAARDASHTFVSNLSIAPFEALLEQPPLVRQGPITTFQREPGKALRVPGDFSNEVQNLSPAQRSLLVDRLRKRP